MEREALQKRRGQTRFGLVVAGTLLVALVGYLGFRLLPTLGDGSETGAALMALAAATGFAAFFSPCSFPIMLTTLGRQANTRTGRARLKPTLRFAAGASIGAVAFLAGLGLFLSLGRNIRHFRAAINIRREQLAKRLCRIKQPCGPGSGHLDPLRCDR